MNKILLSQLHQEVSIQLDVKVEVGHSGLGLLDVQVQGSIKETDSLNFVASETPFKLGFEEGVFGALALLVANLEEEFELLSGIVVLLLLNSAVYHAIEGHQEGFITCSSTLIRLICGFILALEAVLIADLCLITSIFRL